MSDPAVVIIATRDKLEPLKERIAATGEVLALTESDAHRAIEMLATLKPSQFILERFFAATPRGTALITRLRADPTLADVEIRVAAHDSDYSRIVTHRIVEAPVPPGPPEPPPPPEPAVLLDSGGTRRALRTAVPEGVEVQVDGKPVVLVDLADGGAQLTSPTVLRPNQRVRVSITWQQEVVRVGATVTWANFEMSKETARPQYRAGLTFNMGEADAIETLSEKWRD